MIENISQKLKEFFGENNELVQSTNNALQERISSPFYGYFLISWFLINWELLYSAFFLDQNIIFEKTGLLRNEYVLSQLLTGKNLLFDFIFIPFIITCLFFWIFPYGTRIFFRRNIKNQRALKIIELQESQKEKKKQKELIQEETALIKKEIEKNKIEKIAERESPEILWTKEFDEFRKTLLFEDFSFIIESIYKHNKNISIQGPHEYSSPIFQIPSNILAYTHLRNLVEISNDGRKISLTDKGKFFAKKFETIKTTIK